MTNATITAHAPSMDRPIAACRLSSASGRGMGGVVGGAAARGDRDGSGDGCELPGGRLALPSAPEGLSGRESEGDGSEDRGEAVAARGPGCSLGEFTKSRVELGGGLSGEDRQFACSSVRGVRARLVGGVRVLR